MPDVRDKTNKGDDIRRSEYVLATALFLALSLFVSQALLRSQQVPRTPNEDLARHVANGLNFQAALEQGQYMPRLQPYPLDSPDSTTFQYYGFLSSAAAQPFLFLGFRALRATVLGVIVLRLAGFLALYASARFAGAGSPAAALAVAAYALTPYCISTFYGRVAVPETAAVAVLPFALLGWTLIIRGRREAGFAVVSLSILLLSLAHPIFMLYGILLLAGLGLFSATWSECLAIAGGIVTGLLTSAFQWFPAFVSRGALTTFAVIESPFLKRNLTSLSGLWGLPQPLGTADADGVPNYFFTPGWWTAPVLIGLVALSVRGRRSKVALPLLAAAGAFLFLAYSPFDVWKLLPAAMHFVQFPYRLLAFCALLTALALAIVLPSIGWKTAGFLAIAMVVTQLGVLKGPDLGDFIALSDDEIASAFASHDYTMARTDQTGVSGIGTDGWLGEDNRVALGPTAAPVQLRIVGSTIFSDPVEIWVSERTTKQRVSEVRSVGPAAFDVTLSIRPPAASSTPLSLVSSRYLVPHEVDPLSTDMRQLSLRLTATEVVNGKPHTMIGAADVERSIVGPYRRQFVVRSPPPPATGDVYTIELPMMYSPFVSVTQGGRHLDTGSSVARRILVNTDVPTQPIEAAYRPPAVSVAGSVAGIGITIVAAVVAYRKRRRTE